MKYIGILGGTFNPIHIGHLAMAQTAFERLKLDSVIFVPSYLPPHKSSQNVIDAKHRYAMVKSAIKGNPSFTLSDFEIKRKSKSYSIDTLEHFHKVYPQGTKFYFIIGEDSLETLPKWKRIEDLLKLVSFVVVNRVGTTFKKSKLNVHSLIMPTLEISSSFIRKKISLGESIRYWVPEKVYQYIQNHKLYRI